MIVDVVICSFNSAATIRQCLEGIAKFVETERIIVVDGGSKDGTQDIVRAHPKTELHVRPDLSLGASRKFAFGLVRTEWFLQIDSDVILTKSLTPTFQKHHTAADVIEFGTNNFYAFPTPTPQEMASGNYERRAFFFTNFIRKSSVPQVDLDVRHMEEELMRRYIVAAGGSWIKTGEVVGDHFSAPMRYEGREIATITRIKPYPRWVYYDMGKIDRLSSVPMKAVVKSAIRVVIDSLNVSALVKAVRSFSNPVANLYHYFLGYFRK